MGQYLLASLIDHHAENQVLRIFTTLSAGHFTLITYGAESDGSRQNTIYNASTSRYVCRHFTPLVIRIKTKSWIYKEKNIDLDQE